MEKHVLDQNAERPTLCRDRRKYVRKGKSAENIEGSPNSPSPSFLNNVPRRTRSKRRVSGKNVVSRQKKKLNSVVFDAYLEQLWKSFSEDKRTSFAYLDCLWFYLYREASFKAKVLKWVKSKRIFTKNYVFVPIVCWNHWSLLILCHFGESLQSGTRSRCMILLDSLENADPKRIEPDVRKFVRDIYKAEARPETEKLLRKIPLLVPKVPQQRNGDECGNYVLYFIQLFMERAPENFVIAEFPYFMKETWFTPQSLEIFFERLSSSQSVACDISEGTDGSCDSSEVVIVDNLRRRSARVHKRQASTLSHTCSYKVKNQQVIDIEN